MDEFEDALFEAYQEYKTTEVPAFPSHRLARTHKLLNNHPPPDEEGGHVLVVGRGEAAYWFRLLERTVVGRNADADLRIEHPWISGTQCIIAFDGHDWQLEDAGARNRCSVNGEVRDRHFLCDGDAIQMGRHVLVFVDNRKASSFKAQNKD